MNLSSLFASSALGGGEPQLIFVTTARTWTAPYDCEVAIHAFGGSGTGGAGRGGGINVSATGGGAGARCSKKIRLKAGDTLILTPGAGGLPAAPGSTAAVDGNDGGDTIVTGPNSLNMVAGGGKAGKGVANAGLLLVLGGLGGVATGGDENVSGGRGGNKVASNAAGHSGCTGGGALPLFDVGYRGGDILAIINTNNATGGAGVGGNGGDITGASVTGAFTGGGGSAGPGVSTATNGQTMGGPEVNIGAVDVPLTPWLPLSGAGGQGHGSVSGAGGIGGGSGGASNTATTIGAPGAFAGSGGANGGSGTTTQNACPDFPSGGTGGVVTSGSQLVNAKAGDGFIILEIY